MNFKRIIAFTGIATAFTVILASSPMIGEMVATMPPLFIKYPREYRDLEYENVSFPSSDGLTLRGWFFPAKNPHAPALFYAPATAHDLRQGLSLVAPLQQAGFHVLLFSYRGSGDSEGNRLTFSYGARESVDIDAAVRYLSETRGIQRIGAIGHSAGAVSIILSAARNQKINAIVAAAPYTTLEDIWEDNRPAAFPKGLYAHLQRLFQLRKGFSQKQVRPIDVIGRISPRPILLIYGSADQRIPKLQASRLFNAAGLPKQIIWLPNVSHAEVRSPGLDNLAPQMIRFFNENLQEKAVAN